VEILEKGGRGLNLTYEVRDGIRNHKTSTKPCTLEGKIVRLSDKIAYIHHDMDDAIRGKILEEEDIPKELRNTLGKTTTERLDRLIHDIIINSEEQNDIRMSLEIGQAFTDLRQFMFQNVYQNPKAKGEENKAERLVESLYEYYLVHLELLPKELTGLVEEQKESRERVVCDYVSAMSDRFAIGKFSEIYLPDSWKE